MLSFNGFESNDSNSLTQASNDNSQIAFLMKKLPILKTVQKNQQLANEISEIFTLFSPQRGKSIKKENLRVSVIRNHKKFLRMIFYPKKNHRSYFKSILKSLKIEACIQKFRQHSLINKDILMDICIPSFGPKSERKVMKESSLQNCSNSFNDFYLYNYFQVKEIKHSFLKFLDVLFADLDIPKLSKEIKLKCCDSHTHSEDCRLKWCRLKIFFSRLMIDDLDERFNGFMEESLDKSDPAELFLDLEI